MFQKTIWLMISAVIIVLASCNSTTVKQDTRVVATYKGGQISFEKFEQDMLRDKFRNNLAQASKSSVKEREDYLKNQLIEKIVAEKSAELKLDTLSSTRRALKEAVSKLSKDKLYEDVVIKKVVKDDELRAEFEASKKTVKAQHILIKSSNSEESVKAKIKADSLYTLLSNGADFNELVAKFSDDKSELNYFGRGQMVKPFEEAAYSLKIGEISKPVETQFGWHIIKLNDIKLAQSIKSFEDSKSEIRLNLFRNRREQAMQVTDEYIAYLRNHFKAQADTANIIKFMEKFRKVSLLPDSLINDTINGFNEHDRNLVLVQYNGQKHTAQSIIREFVSVPSTQGRPDYKTVNDVVKFYDRYLINDLLDKIIVELNYQNDPEIVAKGKEQLKPLFRQELEKRFALSQLSDPSDSAMQSFYDANKEKLYKNKEEFRPFSEVKESIKTKLRREAENKAKAEWYEKIVTEYDFKADKLMLEEAFYFVEDNKK